MTRRSWIAWLVAALIAAGGSYLLVHQPTPPPTATAMPSLSASVSVPPGTPTTSSAAATPSQVPATSGGGTCTAGDQNGFVYHPTRLTTLSACVTVTGTVALIRREADGDLHVLLALDPAYTSLLRPANAQEHGDLVVEPVCEAPVTQPDAVAVCASDPDPLNVAGLIAGEHVSISGRLVLDTDHGSWSEIHALGAWWPAP
jgi:hypothetical protein